MSIRGWNVPDARRWAALFLGVLIVVVISSIPAVGGWLAFLIALGGVHPGDVASAARPAADLTRLRTQLFPLPDRLR
jgi:hypothetical protein